MFTQPTAVVHKYLNDELKILCLLQFFPEVAQNSLRIPRVFHVQRNPWVFQVFQVYATLQHDIYLHITMNNWKPSFNVLMLLIRRQEGHPACHNSCCEIQHFSKIYFWGNRHTCSNCGKTDWWKNITKINHHLSVSSSSSSSDNLITVNINKHERFSIKYIFEKLTDLCPVSTIPLPFRRSR